MSDADGIHAYVFAPRELRLIRGGSALQRKANANVAQLIPPSGRKVFAGGGSVLAAFPDKQLADEFCRKARNCYRETTDIAIASTAYVEYAGEFGKAYQELGFKLELVKQNRVAPHFNGGSPYWVSCQSCGLQPVATESRSPEPNLICHACQLREEAIKHRKASTSEPKDFEAIARDARPQNYLAILYLDFDRLGRYLDEQIQAVEDRFREDRFRMLSSLIDSAILHAVQEAGKHAPNYVPLLIGGDDAIVAMAAQHAIAFLKEFRRCLDEFWAEKEQTLRARRPTFSAGLVMAHSHFPISEFMRIAEDLLRSAKRHRDVDAVDYEVVTNSMVGKVVSEREKLARRRTAKPYAWEKLNDLVSRLSELKTRNVPASKLKALYQISYHSDFQADLEYLHLLSRLEPAHRDLLRRAVGPTLWQKDVNGAIATNAADLAELWEFV